MNPKKDHEEYPEKEPTEDSRELTEKMEKDSEEDSDHDPYNPRDGGMLEPISETSMWSSSTFSSRCSSGSSYASSLGSYSRSPLVSSSESTVGF